MKFQKLISFALTLVMSLCLVFAVAASPSTHSSSQTTFEKVFKQNPASVEVAAQPSRKQGAGIILNESSVGSANQFTNKQKLYKSPSIILSGNFAYQARGKI